MRLKDKVAIVTRRRFRLRRGNRHALAREGRSC